MNLNESKVYAAAMMLNNAERQRVAIAILSTVGVQSDIAIVPRAEGRHSAPPQPPRFAPRVPKRNEGEKHLTLPKIHKTPTDMSGGGLLTVDFHPLEKKEGEEEEPRLASWAVEKFSMAMLRHGLHVNLHGKPNFIPEEEWASGVIEDVPRDISGTQIKLRTTLGIAHTISAAGSTCKMINHSTKDGIVFRYTVSLAI